jgi:NAD(P)-dependent dehydrogenase (short-subunit alcohol dehydrogenase family)
MKTVLITGISKGIGKSLAQKYVKEGWKVIGTSTSGTVDFDDKNLKTYRLDLSSPESIKECADSIIATGIKIDVLHNNAGALFDEEETQVVVDLLRKTLEVNLIGTIDFCERIIPLVNKGGHIVNTSSQAGSLTREDDDSATHFPHHYPAYKISKAALNMYTRTLSGRLKRENGDIIVSSVHPGWVKTAMGGDDAPISPEEAADDLYKLATSHPETGQFWFKDKKYPW